MIFISERQLAIITATFALFLPLVALHGIGVDAFKTAIWIASPILWICSAYGLAIYADKHYKNVLPERGAHAFVATLTVAACGFASMFIWAFLTYIISKVVIGYASSDAVNLSPILKQIFYR